ncbi:MAG: cyclic nucleotide-binding domain-containing protein [Gammaproteobacteria bacterium]
MNQTACKDLIVSKETIKASPLGKELTDGQCLLLAEAVTACGIGDGEFLIKEGQKDDAIHIITMGNMEAVTQTGGGGWVSLQILREGDMVGEMGFIDGIEHSASLRAMGNCELIRLERENFEALLQKDPDLVYKVMRALMREVHRILRGMNKQYAALTDYVAR